MSLVVQIRSVGLLKFACFFVKFTFLMAHNNIQVCGFYLIDERKYWSYLTQTRIALTVWTIRRLFHDDVLTVRII
jgi:hypothetical protein